MQYVQLFALQQGATGFAGFKELDLYSQEPIKITKSVLSIDDITINKSSFSRTFRVPHSNTNGIFFRSVFNVNSIDFDATVRAQAYINVNGSTFDTGNIQLGAIYRNDSTGKIEYEIIFLGNTSAFATEVGPRDMSQIDLSDLSHELTFTNIIQSWQPGGTGLFNGDIVYPLAEYGYSYTEGVPDQSTLSATGSTGGFKSFTLATNPLNRDQFRPAIRASVIWDQIFAGTNYTYTSDFVDNFLSQLYVMASNYASPTTFPQINFEGLINATKTNNSRRNRDIIGQTPFKITLGTLVENYGNAYVLPDQFYRAPVSNLTYNFTVRLNATFRVNTFSLLQGYNIVLQMRVFNASGAPITAKWQNRTVVPTFANLANAVANNILIQAQFALNATRLCKVANSGPTNTFLDPVFTAPNLQKGDTVEFFIQSISPGYRFLGTEVGGDITLQIPGSRMVDPSGFLPAQYKQLEFIKAVNDRFKLVWEENKDVPNGFIIEPYNDWVLGGVQKDWTYKLNESDDLSVTPLFYSQPREIIYKDSEEADLFNFSYQQANKETFGQINADSRIELITGVKEIKSLFAPLPVGPIGNSNKFLIPHFAKDTEAQRQPIVIKPRIGFIALNVDTQGIEYYIENDAGTPIPFTTYPLYSSFNKYPFDSESFDLNWTNPVQFWDAINLGFDGRTSFTAFNTYWRSWFESLYDPYSRLVEATFALDVEDVQGLSFNDKIYLKNAWYLVLEIKDYVLNSKNNVRVKLLKLGNLGINITGISAGVKQFVQNNICYSTVLCDACCCLTYSVPIYTDGTTLATSLTASYDLSNQQPVIDGFYSDGTDAYEIIGGNIVSVGTCSGCQCVPGGLTEFSDVCQGSSFCEVCCCVSFEVVAFGDGPTLDTSFRVFTGSTGGAFLPGVFLRANGETSAVQIGQDGTTIVGVAQCSQCICDPLVDQSQFIVGGNPLDTCCIQAPDSFGAQSMFTDTGFVDTASVFYYDPYDQFPVGGTGTVYVSDGEYVVEVVGATAGGLAVLCDFPATGCTGRTEVIPFNVVNAGPNIGELQGTYFISFDGVDYYYNGSDSDTGIFNNTHNPVYATGSSFNYQINVPAPFTGSVQVEYYKNSVLELTQSFTTPASYQGPSFGNVGQDTYNVDVTLVVT